MRAFLLLASVLATILAAGCGGDDEPTQASRTVTDSGATTTAVETATVEEPTTGDAPATTTGPEDEDEPAPATEPDAPPTTEPDDTPTSEAEPPVESSGDDEAAARETALAFLRGLSGGDGGQACATMTEQVRRQVEKTLGQAPAFKGKDCAEILTGVAANYPAQMRRSMRRIEVVAVEIDGQIARVSYRAGSLQEATVPLVRVDGDWKVGALAAPGQTG